MKDALYIKTRIADICAEPVYNDREMIQIRDELQKKSGYYKIYPQTKIIDVTNCKSAKESEKFQKHQ